MPVRLTFCCALLLVLAQCGTVPVLPPIDRGDGTVLAHPQLVPTAGLISAMNGATAVEQSAGLQARASALRRRARSLQGPVLTRRERRLLVAALARRL